MSNVDYVTMKFVCLFISSENNKFLVDWVCRNIETWEHDLIMNLDEMLEINVEILP